ncbi:MAG: chain length determinant protein tyrosine kinase EpsG [Burkholderiales bacterium]|nr:chain length determinant protein tyrosine kinase EpsG [Burkholderiales bacterium]
MNQRVPPTIATLPVDINRDTSIGRILLEQGKITPTDAERVLRLQREQGMRFGEAAQCLGLISEVDVQQVLARQFGFSYLQPGQGEYPPELVAAYEPFGEEAEMLRGVRSQLLQRWFSAGRRSLAVASMNPGEGTSFLIANLAVVFAQLGEQTLLVDANMRRPRQQDIFRIRSRQGLSEMLAGRAGMNAIARIEYFDDLSVLPAGTIPPNPQELLFRPTFRELYQNLCRHFSVILFDLPPFSAGADALAITAHVGGVLLVAHRNATHIADVNVVRERIKRTGAEVVGSVLVDF